MLSPAKFEALPMQGLEEVQQRAEEANQAASRWSADAAALRSECSALQASIREQREVAEREVIQWVMVHELRACQCSIWAAAGPLLPATSEGQAPGIWQTRESCAVALLQIGITSQHCPAKRTWCPGSRPSGCRRQAMPRWGSGRRLLRRRRQMR